MGDVLVNKGTVQDGRITTLQVELHGLGTRIIDRDTAMRWMKDGHSLIPVIGGARTGALQLVEIKGDESHPVIRIDNANENADTLGDIPTM